MPNRKLRVPLLSAALAMTALCSLTLLSLSYPSFIFSGNLVQTPRVTRTPTPTGIPTATPSHIAQAEFEQTATERARAFADVDSANRIFGISVHVQSWDYYGYNRGEIIFIYNRRSTTTRLAGLSLLDEDGYEIALPNVVIEPNGYVSIHTDAGENSARDIYLAIDEDVWQPDEQVTLRGRSGTIYAIGRVSLMSLTLT